MNVVIHEMLKSPLVERLGWTLLHSLWQGALAAAVLKAVLMATRDRAASERYVLACFILLMTLGACIYTFSVVRIAQHPPVAVAMMRGSATPIEVRASTFERLDLPANPPLSSGGFKAGGIVVRPAQTPAPIARPPEISWRTKMQRQALAWFPVVLPWLALIWALGVFCMSLWNFGGWLAVQQLRYLNTRPVAGDGAALLRNLASRLGLSRTVRLVQSALARTPLVIGVFRPMILVPAAVFTDLPIAELESILAHELAHVLRHDYLVNLLQSVIETLLFYHPAIWWISRQIRIEREHCCDDLAIRITRDRATYVRALAAVASVRVPALAPAAAAGKLLPRLRRILGAPPSQERVSTRGLAGALMVLCFAAALVVHFRPVAKAADDAHSSTPSNVADDLVTVRGQVFDPQGRPVTGARISAAPPLISGGNVSFDTNQSLPHVVAATHSGPDGKFALSFKKSAASVFVMSPGTSGADLWKKARIVAAADGYGMAWKKVDQLDERGELALNLVADEPIDGRIIDLEGRPVAGAPIVVSFASDYVAPGPAATVDLKNPPVAHDLLNYPLEMLEGAAPIVTDQDGRFHLAGLGKDRVIHLNSQSQRAAIVDVQVLTRDVLPPRSAGIGKGVLYSSHFEIAAPPALTIAGTVRDASTHLPVGGVRVEAGDARQDARSITDAQGRYRLDGIPSRAGHSVILCFVCDDQPYLPLPYEQAPAAASNEPVKFDVELHKGIWITGKVTSKGSSAAVPAVVGYWPFTSNEAARGLAPFNSFNSIGNPGYYVWQTRPDGSYRVVGLPGPGVVYVSSRAGLYLQGIGFDQLPGITQDGYVPTLPALINTHNNIGAIAQLNAPADKTSAQVDLQLDPGRSIRINCIDPQGAPISDLSVIGARSRSYSEVLSGSSFDSVAFSPDETRLILIRSRRQALGKAMVIRAADAVGGQITVQLQPLATITGRLVNADGDPIKGGRVEPAPVLADKTTRMPGFTTTSESDEQGRFSLSLATGCDYRLDAFPGPASNLVLVKQTFSLHPGDQIDLGDVSLNGPKAGQTASPSKAAIAAEKPMGVAAAPAMDDIVHVHGRVLDPSGKPLANARVVTSPTWPAGYDQQLRPVVQTVSRSDGKGRFEISFSKAEASPFSLGYGQPGAELWKKMKVAATAPGMGIAWKQFDDVDPAGDVVLQLVEDLPLEGRIVDLEGRAVAGVKVIATYVGNYLQKDYVNKPPPAGFSYLSFPAVAGGLDAPLFSDSDGRFRISGMGRERSVGLDFQSDKVVIFPIRASTHEGPPITIALGSDKAGHFTYYGNKVEITAAPAVSVVGVVRDAQTKQPLAGVSVRTSYSRYDARAVTDAQGRYRLDGLERQQNVEITARSLEEAYLPSILRLPDRRDRQQVTLDFELTRGVWITGKVTDRATGAPVPAEIDYFAFVSNKIAAAIPLLSEGRAQSPLYGETLADGSYRVIGLPGRGVVVARSRDDRYRMGLGFDQIKDRNRLGGLNTLFPFVDENRNNAAREINIIDAPPTVDFQLEAGGTLHIACFDPGGKPIDVDVRANHVSAQSLEYGHSATGTFDMLGLSSAEQYMLVAINNKRKLGKVLLIGRDELQRGQLTIRLEPTAIVTGRLINPDGDPVKGGRIQVDTVLPAAGRSNLDNVAIDQNSGSDGRFTLCLPGGCTYGILASHNPYGGEFNVISRDLQVTSGQNVDLGDVTVSPVMPN